MRAAGWVVVFLLPSLLKGETTVNNNRNVHNCIHDQLDHPVGSTSHQSYAHKKRRRLVADSPEQKQFDNSGEGSGAWEPLRIEVVFEGIPRGDYIASKLMPEAIQFWERTLKVRRVQGPLLLSRSCPSEKFLLVKGDKDVADVVDGACFSDKTQSSDHHRVHEHCGVNSFRIPEDLLSGMVYCDRAGILSSSGSGLSGVQIKDKYCSEVADAAGVQADYVIFVTSEDTTQCREDTSGSLQAYATWCRVDQFNRPIAGAINFCPHAQDEVQFAEDIPVAHEFKLTTAVHELAHALGFTAMSMAHLRHPDGIRPRTPRDEMGYPPRVKYACGRDRKEWAANPLNVVEVFSERGIEDCTCPLGGSPAHSHGDDGDDKNDDSDGDDNSDDNSDDDDTDAKRSGGKEGGMTDAEMMETCTAGGSCVFKIVTEKVREKAREYFGCATLQGAELENQPTTTCTILGSHWEQRIFGTELMTSSSYAGAHRFISPVTLAYFEDTGWYQPDYDQASPLRKDREWGFGQGCDFALEKCVRAEDPSSSSSSQVATTADTHWCTVKDMTQTTGSSSFVAVPSTCFPDRLAQAACNLGDWGEDLPEAYRYFKDMPRMGGIVRQPDFCPMFVPLSNRLCTDHQMQMRPEVNFMGESYCGNCRCFESSLHRDISGHTLHRPKVGCYEVKCDLQALNAWAIKIRVRNAAAQTPLWVTCTGADVGKSKSVHGYKGTITCVDPEVFCPHRLRMGEVAHPDLASDLEEFLESPAYDHSKAETAVAAAASVEVIVLGAGDLTDAEIRKIPDEDDIIDLSEFNPKAGDDISGILKHIQEVINSQ